MRIRDAMRKDWRYLKWPVALMVWSWTAFLVAMMCGPVLRDGVVISSWHRTANLVQFISTLLVGMLTLLFVRRLHMCRLRLLKLYISRWDEIEKKSGKTCDSCRDRWEKVK